MEEHEQRTAFITPVPPLPLSLSPSLPLSLSAIQLALRYVVLGHSRGARLAAEQGQGSYRRQWHQQEDYSWWCRWWQAQERICRLYRAGPRTR